ncbi:ribose-5-phosphate isomerase RpiA [Methanothermococcus okinawensis]|uniref:Ribose-5-phosphate isomerase A n=1 Tax=Methanothermococcus okinawensis (strain DSM 14208 / JCM 11175 / IH1) TaxID=647113 RepID=F8AKY5_METOI|nr:ribose-5-phosphate isomerase RpiA [Methanothermococcus okinawensis]AEH06388.1 Ribose-5-phosphate isomerase A [Methanothermococcus okinawensis IH1]
MAKSSLKSSSNVENAKFRVAKEAANLVKDGMIVGLGSGTTANLFIDELGRRVAEEELSVFGIPTSFESRMLAIQYGIPLVSLDEYGEIDIAIDGADEVDKKSLCLIKGGGGCHTLEKIIDYCAKEFVVMVDENKIVDSLGDKTPVPLEVLPIAYSTVLNELLKRNAAPSIRMADRKMGPVITDNGNMIIDVFIDLKNPEETEKELNSIPGVVENGIFTKVDKILVGSPKKVKILSK